MGPVAVRECLGWAGARRFCFLLAVLAFGVLSTLVPVCAYRRPRFEEIWGPVNAAGSQPLPAAERSDLALSAREAFFHAYNSYLQFGFPKDDVRPLSCRSSNSQGGIGLTLMDSLDALLVLDAPSQFAEAVDMLSHRADFDVDARVHTFEVTIRALGGLLSAHVQLLRQPALSPDYSSHLLDLAVDLADRLMPAFDTPTGMPLSWVNLASGQVRGGVKETCTACATTLLLEFGLLSHLTGDPVYADAADAAVRAVYARRSRTTDLVGNTLHTDTGIWTRGDAGIGAGSDSYYEYLLKSYLMFGDPDYLEMFVTAYTSADWHMRLLGTTQSFAWLFDVDMNTGRAQHATISSLSAFWPGLQAFVGHVTPAVHLHANYTAAFQYYGWLPEQIDMHVRDAHRTEVAYPLRPELVESAYSLYAATSDPRYLRIGQGVLETLNAHNRGPCGYAAVGNVTSGALEDAMESFFLSETARYLFLLFSGSTAPLEFWVTSTEGHLMPVLPFNDTEAAALCDDLSPEGRAAEACGAGAHVQKHPDSRPGTSSDSHPDNHPDSDPDDQRPAEPPHAAPPEACAAVCASESTHAARSRAVDARARFPSLTFDPAAYLLLRARRCRVCTAVHTRAAALATDPPRTACQQQRTLHVALDEACETDLSAVVANIVRAAGLERMRGRREAARVAPSQTTAETRGGSLGAGSVAPPTCLASPAEERAQSSGALPQSAALNAGGTCTDTSADISETSSAGFWGSCTAGGQPSVGQSADQGTGVCGGTAPDDMDRVPDDRGGVPILAQGSDDSHDSDDSRDSYGSRDSDVRFHSGPSTRTCADSGASFRERPGPLADAVSLPANLQPVLAPGLAEHLTPRQKLERRHCSASAQQQPVREDQRSFCRAAEPGGTYAASGGAGGAASKPLSGVDAGSAATRVHGALQHRAGGRTPLGSTREVLIAAAATAGVAAGAAEPAAAADTPSDSVARSELSSAMRTASSAAGASTCTAQPTVPADSAAAPDAAVTANAAPDGASQAGPADLGDMADRGAADGSPAERAGTGAARSHVKGHPEDHGELRIVLLRVRVLAPSPTAQAPSRRAKHAFKRAGKTSGKRASAASPKSVGALEVLDVALLPGGIAPELVVAATPRDVLAVQFTAPVLPASASGVIGAQPCDSDAAAPVSRAAAPGTPGADGVREAPGGMCAQPSGSEGASVGSSETGGVPPQAPPATLAGTRQPLPGPASERTPSGGVTPSAAAAAAAGTCESGSCAGPSGSGAAAAGGVDEARSSRAAHGVPTPSLPRAQPASDADPEHVRAPRALQAQPASERCSGGVPAQRASQAPPAAGLTDPRILLSAANVASLSAAEAAGSLTDVRAALQHLVTPAVLQHIATLLRDEAAHQHPA